MSVLELKGCVVKGVQVASGSSPRCQNQYDKSGKRIKEGQYAGGTIKLQRQAMKYDSYGGKKYLPLAEELDEMGAHNGTINVKLDDYLILNPKKCEYIVRDLYWYIYTIESFTYAKAKLYVEKLDKEFDCFLYRPHCSKLSEHSRDICEVIAPKIDGLFYGDDVVIRVSKEKVREYGIKDRIKLKISGGDSPDLDR